MILIYKISLTELPKVREELFALICLLCYKVVVFTKIKLLKYTQQNKIVQSEINIPNSLKKYVIKFLLDMHRAFGFSADICTLMFVIRYVAFTYIF